MKKHDEKTAPTTVVETESSAVAAVPAPRAGASYPLDAPLGSKLDTIGDPAIRESVAARLRLMEAMLLDRVDRFDAALGDAGDDADADAEAGPDAALPAAVVDVAKARAIADQLKRKPQA